MPGPRLQDSLDGLTVALDSLKGVADLTPISQLGAGSWTTLPLLLQVIETQLISFKLNSRDRLMGSTTYNSLMYWMWKTQDSSHSPLPKYMINIECLNHFAEMPIGHAFKLELIGNTLHWISYELQDQGSHLKHNPEVEPATQFAGICSEFGARGLAKFVTENPEELKGALLIWIFGK
ncbi:hypothetical protein K474DRAFT_1677998 [Panus rudis PR-1116 ss-1]|nr:hypothetical protein K474DRAFT_1677998 [Panus rudis PR-1116 ss-1]